MTRQATRLMCAAFRWRFCPCSPASGAARAEPAFAIRTGYRLFDLSHVNNTGGGIRTAFGSIYTQTILAGSYRSASWRDGGNLLPANPDARFNAGADVRDAVSTSMSRATISTTVSSFEVTEANVYLLGRLIPRHARSVPGRKCRPRWSFRPASCSRCSGSGSAISGPGSKPASSCRTMAFGLPDDNSFVRNSDRVHLQRAGYRCGVRHRTRPLDRDGGRHVNGEAGSGGDNNNEKKVVAQAVRQFSDLAHRCEWCHQRRKHRRATREMCGRPRVACLRASTSGRLAHCSARWTTSRANTMSGNSGSGCRLFRGEPAARPWDQPEVHPRLVRPRPRHQYRRAHAGLDRDRVHPHSVSAGADVRAREGRPTAGSRSSRPAVRFRAAPVLLTKRRLVSRIGSHVNAEIDEARGQRDATSEEYLVVSERGATKLGVMHRRPNVSRTSDSGH